MSLYLGIDPGLYGAIAFFSPETGALSVEDMPLLTTGKTGKNTLNVSALAKLFDEKSAEISHVFIEQVSAMPGQGVTSMFNFGNSCGLIHGIVAANFLPRTFVSPQKWKKALKVPAVKDGARARASELMPAHSHLWTLKKHDGRAEAALIAYYGFTQGGNT